MFPGDDVLLAIDTSASDQAVLWLDWSRKPPERWVALMPFAAFVERLAVSSDVNAK